MNKKMVFKPMCGEAEWPKVFDRAESSAAFTRDEVVHRLRYRANAAPGPNGITYSDLKKADPSAHTLTALFNAIMRPEHLPPLWKKSVTTLLHKKGELGETTGSLSPWGIQHPNSLLACWTIG